MKRQKEKVVTKVTAFFLPSQGHPYTEIGANLRLYSVAFGVLVLARSPETRAEPDRPTRERLSSKNSCGMAKGWRKGRGPGVRVGGKEGKGAHGPEGSRRGRKGRQAGGKALAGRTKAREESTPDPLPRAWSPLDGGVPGRPTYERTGAARPGERLGTPGYTSGTPACSGGRWGA